MQVHDVPLLINGDYQTVTYTVGSGVGVFYGPQPGTGDGLRASNSSTFVAAGGSFTVSRPVYVVAETKTATADLRVGDALSAGSAGAAGLYPLAADVPTLEELQFAITTTTSGVTTAGNLVLASAMFPMKIAAFSIINSSANPGSAANLWTFTLERLRNVAGVATAATIAQKTTYKAGGGDDMIANVDWPWDAVAFDATNQMLQKGDVLRIAWAPTGTPTALQVRCYTVRYEPI